MYLYSTSPFFLSRFVAFVTLVYGPLPCSPVSNLTTSVGFPSDHQAQSTKQQTSTCSGNLLLAQYQSAKLPPRRPAFCFCHRLVSNVPVLASCSPSQSYRRSVRYRPTSRLAPLRPNDRPLASPTRLFTLYIEARRRPATPEKATPNLRSRKSR